MSNSKIVVDADTGKIEAGAKRTEEGFKRIGKEAGNVGGQIDKWGRQLADKVAGLGAILATIRAVGQEIDRQKTAAAGANRSLGGGALGRSQAVRELGLDQIAGGAANVDAVITGGAGGTSVESRDAFLAAMAGRKGKDRITSQNAMKALSLFNSGLFSQDELLSAATGSGRGLDAMLGQQGQRFEALSPQAREELAFRQRERENANQIAELTTGRGRAARVSEGQEDLFTARNPLAGGFRNVVRTASGGMLDLLESETVVGKDGSAFLREQSAILRQIAESNNRMAAPRPTMSPTTEAGP